MLNITGVKPYTANNVNFKSDYQQIMYPQMYYREEPSQSEKIKNKIKKMSLSQTLGVVSSAVVIAFFGMLLHKEISASRMQRKIANAMKETGERAANSIEEAMKNCKSEQIKRAVAEEYAKGPMMMSNKKVQALAELSQIVDETIKPIDIEKAKEILDQRVIGMNGIKKQVIEFLEYRNKCIESGIKPDKPLVLSFDGPPGTAKTTLAQAIAEAAGLPHKEINMAGATGKAKIIGNESVYTGASWGEFADAQLEYKTKNIVYTLDELEKTGTSDYNGKVEDTLLPLLDGRHKIKDDFLGVDIDISDSIVIVTTNNFNKLSEPLRDRISYKFSIPPYTLKEKAAIAKFKFENSMKHHQIQDKVKINDDVFDLIAENVSDQGGREVSETVQNLGHKIFALQKNTNEEVIVDKKMVKNWLKDSTKAA